MEYSIGRRKLSRRQNNIKFGGEGLVGLRLHFSRTYKRNAHFRKIFLKLRVFFVHSYTARCENNLFPPVFFVFHRLNFSIPFSS